MPSVQRPEAFRFVQGGRRRPTLPRSLERSTIGAVGLNDRVRNGNECGPYALVASDFCMAVRTLARRECDNAKFGRSEFKEFVFRGSYSALLAVLVSQMET